MNQTHQHTVAYPGPPGSHASAAAAALFPRENLVPVGGFHAVADAVACADAAHGVLPIESSLAGTVAETHDLLNEHSLSIVGEAVLPIHHVLAASADVPLDEIRIVRSHPTALEQCRGLLQRMPRATALPAATTAEAAREAAEVGDPTVAAIAGAGAAALYGLVVLEDDVGDGPAFTRFVSIAPYTWLGGAKGDARTAFTFVTDHRPGALPRAGPDRARGSRPRPDRLAADSRDAVELPLRRGHRRASARQRGAGRAGRARRDDALASRPRGLRSSGGDEMSTVDDPHVARVRREISDLDSKLVEIVNKRLKLVAQLKRYKEEHGLGFVDLAREEWMLQYLHRMNRGPLSADGLARLYHELLALMKHEVVAQEE